MESDNLSFFSGTFVSVYFFFTCFYLFTVEQPTARGKVGSIADYDPMADNWGSLGGGYQPASATSGRQEWEETFPAQPPQQQQQPGTTQSHNLCNLTHVRSNNNHQPVLHNQLHTHSHTLTSSARRTTSYCTITIIHTQSAQPRQNQQQPGNPQSPSHTFAYFRKPQ